MVTTSQIPPQDPDSQPRTVNQGGTVLPIYGVRRPVMYHLFETEMNSVSAFNGEALRWFSFGAFFLNCIIAVVVGWCYSSRPLNAFAEFMVKKGVWLLALLTVASFAYGFWIVHQKHNLIEQIKRETRTESGG
jgi:hypothetical protein